MIDSDLRSSDQGAAVGSAKLYCAIGASASGGEPLRLEIKLRDYSNKTSKSY